ncbi:MAG: immunoglobulin domain-containing protein, partial [Bacteroidetes bacterium]|nr:immunoglobulin domain-containing protein [Bacteroidota bacterium]
GDDGTIVKTTDGGVTWTVLNTGFTDLLADVYFVTPNEGFAVGTDNIYTLDGGANWSTFSGFGFGYTIYFRDYWTGFEANGDFFKTTTGGGVLPGLQAPVVTSDPNSTIACENDSVTFQISSTGTDPRTYQWFKDSLPIAGATDTILIVAATLPNEGVYYCSISNLEGTALSDTAVLSVIEPFNLSPDPPQQESYCEGDSLCIVFSTDQPDRAYSFDYYKDGNFLQSSTDSFLCITGFFTINDTGTYMAVAEDSCTTDTAYWIASYLSLPLPDLGPDTSIFDTATLVLTPGTFASYDWSNGSTDPTLLVDGSTWGLGKDTISLLVQDANGCEGIDTVVIEVLESQVGGMSEKGLNQEALLINIYPNPALNYLWVERKMLNTQLELRIIDLAGVRVLSTDFIGSRQVSLKALKPGLYFIQF